MKQSVELGTRILLQLVLGFVFLYAGLQKISHQNEFLLIVKNYQLIPLNLERIFSLVLPWMEFTIGSMLVLGIYVKQAALIAILVLVTFSMVIGINIIRGISFSCGCFSLSLEKGSEFSSLWWIMRDLALAGIGVYIYGGKRTLRKYI